MNPRRLLSELPSVSSLLEHEELVGARDRLRHDVLVRLIQQELDARRTALLAGRAKKVPGPEDFARKVKLLAMDLLDSGMRRVLNATGVILHTGLGRAVLAERAQERVAEISRGNTDLEFKLDSGKRGQREERAAHMLQLLTGAEDALICNNNAAAVSLMLSALCSRREVIVSRGQQVEIGGGFRIPDVIRRSGAKLVEVGCTNRTHLDDYASAIGPRTAAILRVHPSNYRVVGFTSETDLGDLAELCRERGILLLDDLGSGALGDFPRVPEPEPWVQESLMCGADLVSFSGDKMLGGPQAGIVLGKRELVRKLARHPMMRAFRCDKLVLAALEATLQIYLETGGEAPHAIPVWKACNEQLPETLKRAEALFGKLISRFELKDGPGESSAGNRAASADDGLQLELCTSTARTGSGALPEQDLPSAAVHVSHQGIRAEVLHRRLRKGRPALVGQVRDEKVILDVKMLRDDELDLTVDLIESALRK